ncbi:hypothetical protein AHAS_Ahas05G0314000 [Arachis hypogaea]
MQQSPSISGECRDPLRDDEYHPSADPPGDLSVSQSPAEEITLQLPRVRPGPRQPHVDVPQLRRAHRVPGGGQGLDRPSPAEDSRLGVVPRGL